ncbi:MAG: hypothetical protein AAB539_01325 [Patescibacteria group bacterium]
MAIQDALEYLEKNSRAFSVEDLTGQLKAHGYPDEEIRVAVGEWQKSRLDRIAKAADAYRAYAPQLSFWQKAARYGAGFLLSGFVQGGSVFITHSLLGFFRPTLRRSFIFWDLDYILIIDGIVYIATPLILYFLLRRRSVYVARGTFMSWIISLVIPILMALFLITMLRCCPDGVN